MASRIYSLDSMRIVAMVFVVAIHTNLFRGLGAYGNVANFVIDSAGRFVVPFFFMTSGYLFALKTMHGDPKAYLVDRMVTIASLYVFGLLLAAPVFLAGAAIETGVDNPYVLDVLFSEFAGFISPLGLLYYGDSVSVILWFLPALAFSLAFVYGFVRTDKTAYLLPISIAVHLVGLLGASYTMFVDIPLEVRDAVFFGFFYTSLGYVIYSRGLTPRRDHSTIYLGLTVLFTAVHVGERYVLGYVLTGDAITQEVYVSSYTIGTALATFFLFMYLLSRPNLGKGTPLPSWGKYAVGIYVVHPAVLYPLERFDEALRVLGYDIGNTLAWHLLLLWATFFGALLVYIAAQKLGALERNRLRLPRIRRIRKSGSN
ncbi:Surface polysaccharide O-acyltransferase, integral membrane enzyme [Natronorubrum sediminis]|uniref:Surface polysaccharide O-acyltransferase, integral membrane enzyme n=1 Tax=Natronorubrum sediminis TaxID=640943 RepID=A0A1H6FR80_9EURY|nr:acyltransferase [Natronorubrum sediminis]SEH12658.1 Surface polysaccharide O-acyltransferase, integral membrane enzyme [Natronorubrum sediminis]